MLAGLVAKPASEPYPIAATPWAIAHGIAMVLSVVLIMFAAANAFLYLFSVKRLKQKKVMKVLGKAPNIEKLKRLNISGLRYCFMLLTFGLTTGLGLAMVKSTSIPISLIDWLVDSKIMLIIISWVLLVVILLLHYLKILKEKTIAYVTMVLFFLILFAITGTAIFCGSKHTFTNGNTKTSL